MQTTVPSQRSSSMLLPSAAMFSASARAPRVLKHAFAARSPLHARAYPFGGRKLVHPVAAYSQATSVDTSDEVAPSKPSWMQHLGKGAAMLGVAALLALGTAGPADAARSGGRMGGARFSSRSPSMSRSYAAPSHSFGGYPTYVAPGLSGGMGYGFFVVPYGYGSGGGILSFLLLMGAMFLVFQVAQSMMGGDALEVGGERVAVGKLQVALLGSARELQTDLDRIADRADTSTTEGLHYVLQETVLALQRNPDYWVYGASELQFERGYDEAEAVFNELSLDERSKFRSETLSNFAGDSRSKEMKNKGIPEPGSSELIVVTILVAADVALKLPKINSREDLRTALNRIGSVPEQSIVAVEVLWTPQDPDDYYTRDEVMADYPSLAIL